jgi:hypothetical protein
MPRAKKQEWGISFVTSANAAGYEWQPWFDPQHGRDREVLAVRGAQGRPNATTVVYTGGIAERTERYGLDNARRAFYGFVRIGRTADAMLRYDVIQWDASNRTQFFFQGNLQPSKRDVRDALMPMIEAFACEYGSLLGDDEPLTLDDWIKKAREFHQLLEVSQALRSARFDNFEHFVHIDEDAVTYKGSFGRSTVAQRGDAYEGREGTATTEIDFFKIASQGQPRERAWMLFSRSVNRALRGGLSLAVHSLNDRTARVEPRHLFHLLYLRLWLDTINGEPLERDLVCRACGEPLRGRRSKRYCNDACRNAFHNQRRAIQGKATEPA